MKDKEKEYKPLLEELEKKLGDLLDLLTDDVNDEEAKHTAMQRDFLATGVTIRVYRRDGSPLYCVACEEDHPTDDPDDIFCTTHRGIINKRMKDNDIRLKKEKADWEKAWELGEIKPVGKSNNDSVDNHRSDPDSDGKLSE